MVRLAFNVGREHEIQPGDLVGVIAGVTRLPREMIGRIDLEPQRSLVDVGRRACRTRREEAQRHPIQRPKARGRASGVNIGTRLVGFAAH
jgi:ATP-dependent RNA helicase DeaD